MREIGKEKEAEEKKKMVRIYVMGKEYKVPVGLTIMKAVEYAGYRYIRGAGCRAGFCGACATIYRKKGDYKLYTALACQTTVEDGMYLVQLPFVPANKAIYDINKLKPTGSTILAYYPEVARCVSCNTCTKVCPQDLSVMEAINHVLRGDVEKVAHETFDCIQCGLCAVRCPAEIPHYHVFQLTRRLYGKHVLPKAKHVEERLKEIKQGKFDAELEKLVQLAKTNPQELKRMYETAPREKE